MTSTRKPSSTASTIFPGGPVGEMRPETMMLVSTMTRTLPSHRRDFAGYHCWSDCLWFLCSLPQALNHTCYPATSRPTSLGLNKQHITLPLDRNEPRQSFQ